MAPGEARPNAQEECRGQSALRPKERIRLLDRARAEDAGRSGETDRHEDLCGIGCQSARKPDPDRRAKGTPLELVFGLPRWAHRHLPRDALPAP